MSQADESASAPSAPGSTSFQEVVDTPFRVQLDDTSAAEVTLVEVASTSRRPGWESFSLVFAGSQPAFHQATYSVTHTVLGSFPLFLVPIITEGDGQHYEAVFNRPIDLRPTGASSV